MRNTSRLCTGLPSEWHLTDSVCTRGCACQGWASIMSVCLSVHWHSTLQAFSPRLIELAAFGNTLNHLLWSIMGDPVTGLHLSLKTAHRATLQKNCCFRSSAPMSILLQNGNFFFFFFSFFPPKYVIILFQKKNYFGHPLDNDFALPIYQHVGI